MIPRFPFNRRPKRRAVFLKQAPAQVSVELLENRILLAADLLNQRLPAFEASTDEADSILKGRQVQIEVDANRNSLTMRGVSAFEFFGVDLETGEGVVPVIFRGQKQSDGSRLEGTLEMPIIVEENDDGSVSVFLNRKTKDDFIGSSLNLASEFEQFITSEIRKTQGDESFFFSQFEFDARFEIGLGGVEEFLFLGTKELGKAGAIINGIPDLALVGDTVSGTLVFNSVLSPLIGQDDEIEVTIDFGDGTTQQHQVSRGISSVLSLEIEHIYDEPGDYVITVDGIITPSAVGGGSSQNFLRTEAPITILPITLVPVEGTEGADTISVEERNGDLIVNVNGVEQNHGPVDRVDGVAIDAKGGDDDVSVNLTQALGGFIFQANLGSDADTLTATGDLTGPTTLNILGQRGADLVDLSGVTLIDPEQAAKILVDLGFGDDTFIGGDFDETIFDSQGEDTVTSAGGNDTLRIGAGDVGAAFEKQNNLIDLGGGKNSLVIENAQADIEIFGGDLTPPSGGAADVVLLITVGPGSSAPIGTYEFKGLDVIDVLQQSNELFVNLFGEIGLEEVTINGSPENDTVNVQGFKGATATTGVSFNGFGGNNSFIGSPGNDSATAENGDNNFEGRDGDDSFRVGIGNNTIDHGLGDDSITMAVGAKGLPTILSLGDGFNLGPNDDVDTLTFTFPTTFTVDPVNPDQAATFDDTLTVDLSSFVGQQIGENTTIENNNAFISALQDIENVTIDPELNVEI
ncbi:MAG: hypothetical protein KDA80_01950, partial [Planctomycetaceae bacterium]|nr:hypothetical protein [Planctomycetaceae bacterium]